MFLSKCHPIFKIYEDKIIRISPALGYVAPAKQFRSEYDERRNEATAKGRNTRPPLAAVTPIVLGVTF